MSDPPTPLPQRQGSGHSQKEKRILLVEVAGGFLRQIPLLGREGLIVEAVDSAAAARDRISADGFQALMVLDPLPDLPIGAFVHQVLRLSSASLRGVLVVRSDEDHDPPTLPVGEGVRVLCCTASQRHGIEAALVELLDLEPRLAVRLEIQLQVAIGSQQAAVPGLTRNVSEGGLLIQTGAPLLPGVRSRVRIELPGRQTAVEAEIEVVRFRRQAGDRRSSVAVRFVDLGGEDRERWYGFLAACH